MEREQYQKQIKDLLQAVETLLKSNNAMGEEMLGLARLFAAHSRLRVLRRLMAKKGLDAY